jgi:hypothetical protein
MSIPKMWAATAAMAALTGSALASPMPLVDVGDGTVYDPNKHLIWLQDWNVNGAQGFATQTAWAESLVFAHSSEWHLPTIDQFIDLFAEFGDPTFRLPFTNVWPGYYWSGTVAFSSAPFTFFPHYGSVSTDIQDAAHFAVAVRTGEVTTAVPEPRTLALAMMALAAAAVAGRKRPA